MKKIIFISLFLIFSLKVISQNFIDTIISDFSQSGCYLTLNIESDEYKSEVVILNRHLFILFSETENLNEEEYILKIRNILKNKCVLHLGNLNLAEWGFLKVPTNEEIEIIATEGKEIFIKHFFSNQVIKNIFQNKCYNCDKMKNDIPYEEWVTIISILSKWGLPVWVDDETGWLTFNESK